MDAQFWFDSWEEGGFKTSFHRHDIHPYIIHHFPPEKLHNMRVLVPLCGKTLDMEYFRQNANHVTGVELVKKAILNYFEEQSLEYQCNSNRFEAKGVAVQISKGGGHGLYYEPSPETLCVLTFGSRQVARACQEDGRSDTSATRGSDRGVR